MNQMSQIIVPLENLFAPGDAPDPNNADPMVIALQVARRYPFLPQPVFIEVERDRIILNYPAASDHARAEAERLAQRAAWHAGNGDCHRAIAIWEQVLQLVPDDLVARRDIGEACSELGDFIKAKYYLSEALLVDFEDIGSLVALANLAVRQEDYGAAEVYALKAVAAGPQNARALNCLGAVQFHTGRHEEALSFLRAAIAFDPEFAPPYGVIAYLSHQQGRHAEAEATLREMFARAKKQDIRSEPIFTQARQLYRKVQDSLAEMQREQARRTAEEFRVAVEKHTGYPIRVVQEGSGDGPVAQVQLAWQHHRDHHLIRCQPSYPTKLMPHLLAHEIMHIRLGYDAHQAERCRYFSLSAANRQAALQAFENRLERLAREGYPVVWLADCTGRLIANLFGALYNYPLDLVVEQKLREKMPTLAPTQFLALTTPLLKEEEQDDYELISRLMPRRFLRALVALRGVQLLFVDSLCCGATDHAARFRHREGFNLARRLWQHWQTKSQALQPGDEYDLVDEFADIVGLRGNYTWLPDPHSNSSPPTPAAA